MTDYEQKMLAEYARALDKAERFMKDIDRVVWDIEIPCFYKKSSGLRGTLQKVSEEMHQIAQDGEV